MKRDYQTFLNRPDRNADVDRAEEMDAFAAASGLSIVHGHLELPDLRIELETPEGRLDYRDVELVTEHYSRGQLGRQECGWLRALPGRVGAVGEEARHSTRTTLSDCDDLPGTRRRR